MKETNSCGVCMQSINLPSRHPLTFPLTITITFRTILTSSSSSSSSFPLAVFAIHVNWCQFHDGRHHHQGSTSSLPLHLLLCFKENCIFSNSPGVSYLSPFLTSYFLPLSLPPSLPILMIIWRERERKWLPRTSNLSFSQSLSIMETPWLNGMSRIDLQQHFILLSGIICMSCSLFRKGMAQDKTWTWEGLKIRNWFWIDIRWVKLWWMRSCNLNLLTFANELLHMFSWTLISSCGWNENEIQLISLTLSVSLVIESFGWRTELKTKTRWLKRSPGKCLPETNVVSTMLHRRYQTLLTMYQIGHDVCLSWKKGRVKHMFQWFEKNTRFKGRKQSEGRRKEEGDKELPFKVIGPAM